MIQLAYEDIQKALGLGLQALGNGTFSGEEASQYQLEQTLTIFCIYKGTALEKLNHINLDANTEWTKTLINSKDALNKISCDLSSGAQRFTSIEDYDSKVQLLIVASKNLRTYLGR